jgi:cell wall-associated NlpC family hydrolase
MERRGRMRKIWGIYIFVIFVSLFAGSTAVMASPATYVVKTGDCLWSIAKANGISVNSIKQLNGLNSDLIYVGQVLTLSNPAPEQTVPSSPTAEQTAPSGPAVVSQSAYIIQPGDSLWSIAQKFGTTVDYLKVTNNLADDTIYPGNTLLVRSPLVSTNISRSGNVSIKGTSVVAKAEQYLGSPYLYGGTSPAGFDCSGFTQFIYRQFQIPINRTAASQYNNGSVVSKTELVAGDLVFFNTSGSGISHVGIYTGNGQFIHASSGLGKVIYSNLNDDYYSPLYVGARRVIK